MFLQAARRLTSFFGGGLAKRRTKCLLSSGKIAVVISHHKNVWALEVTQRFIASLRDLVGINQTPGIDILSANSDYNHLAQTVIPTIIDFRHEGRPYAAVVTIGDWASQVVRDEFEAQGVVVPQVFLGVEKPASLGLVDSLDAPGRAVTGVTTVRVDFDLQLRKLKAVLPQIGTILMVGDSSEHGIAMPYASHDAFASACAKLSLRVIPCLVGREGDTQQVVRAALREHKIDVVCMMQDICTQRDIDVLISLCTKEQVPLCGSDLSSVCHGAAFGFGETGGSYGPYAANILCDIMLNKRTADTIPVIRLTYEPRMCFNTEAMIRQGVVLSTQAKDLLSMNSVFHR